MEFYRPGDHQFLFPTGSTARSGTSKDRGGRAHGDTSAAARPAAVEPALQGVDARVPLPAPARRLFQSNLYM